MGRPCVGRVFLSRLRGDRRLGLGSAATRDPRGGRGGGRVGGVGGWEVYFMGVPWKLDGLDGNDMVYMGF